MQLLGDNEQPTKALDERFRALCQAWNIHQQISQEWWQRLGSLYTATDRHYHSLVHLHAMFDWIQPHFHRLTRPDLVTAAIFFHDAVYDAKLLEDDELFSFEDKVADASC